MKFRLLTTAVAAALIVFILMISQQQISRADQGTSPTATFSIKSLCLC